MLIWAPRIIAMLFIAFLALFSSDVFDGAEGFWTTLIALFIHNLPSLILLIALILSWKYEIVGGITFILAGLVYVIFLTMRIMNNPPFQWEMLGWSLLIAGPACLTGALFLLGWKAKKR